MKKYTKLTPEGTRDYLFEECTARNNINRVLSNVFYSHGFNQVVTSCLEFYDVFTMEDSGIRPEFMYKLTDNKGRLMVLRPDSTLPIARMVSTRLQNKPKPIRLYYSQNIYRNNPGLTGRNNINLQSGIELMGADGLRADLEVITTATEALKSCVPDFRIEIGHAEFFKSLVKGLNVSDDIIEDIRVSIESKNYSSLDMILDNLDQTEAALAMRKLPRLFGGEEVFDEAARLCPDEEYLSTLNYLRKLYKYLTRLGLEDKLIIDLGLVQRNNYYSGIVFSAYAEGSGEAVLIGGRYNNLLNNFGLSMPAIGFGINTDILTKIAIESGNISPSLNIDVLIHGEEGYEMKALEHCSYLVKAGLKCENSIFETKEEAIKYAKKCNIKRIDIVKDSIKIIEI